MMETGSRFAHRPILEKGSRKFISSFLMSLNWRQTNPENNMA